MPEQDATRMPRWKQTAALILLPLIAVGAVILMTVLAGEQAITRGDRQLEVELTLAVPPLPGTPIARYAALDPAVVAYLDAMPQNLAVSPPDTDGFSLPPLGAFLPRTGNVGAALDAAPDPLPTPRPYLTGTPFPLPTVPPLATVPPSPTPERAVAPTAVAAAVTLDAECAPAGLPVNGLLTQYYHTYHVGIDLSASLGSPVYATHSATVIFAGWDSFGYGNLVILQNGAFITYYAHNTSLTVVLNQQVNKGDIIAWSGSTGNSTGPHVHYETRINDVPVDPLTFEERGYVSC